MSEELAKMNAAIEETRQNRIAALRNAIFRRGLKRKLWLQFARVYGKLEKWQIELRDMIMRGDD